MHSEFLNELWNDLCSEFIYEIESQIRSYVEELEIRLFVLFFVVHKENTKITIYIQKMTYKGEPIPQGISETSTDSAVEARRYQPKQLEI